MNFRYALFFFQKEKSLYTALHTPLEISYEPKISKDYLKILKLFLNLPNDMEKDKDGLYSLLSIIEEKNNKYIITKDNFKKMMLLIYRIKANIPVIIMGEKGSGKTSLVIKLSQLLNNGISMVEIINIYPGMTDTELCEIMKYKDEIAKKRINEELWLFFDEINNCSSLSLLTEIFIKRTYNGNEFSDNIRLIGTCIPYRKRKVNKEKYGLNLFDNNNIELVHSVQPISQSLLYYVFSFGPITDMDERKYIYSIIEQLFSSNEFDLHNIATEAISQCFRFLRNNFDPSVVSLREMSKFLKCVYFFNYYFKIKNKYQDKINNDKNNKLRSIICSIYINYYIGLTDYKMRRNFEMVLRPILLKLINNNINYENNGGNIWENLVDQIKNDDFKNELLDKHEETLNNFGDFLKIEEDFILNQIEVEEGIGKNTLLKENIFLLFLSINTKIPLIIIGKPGTGKSLSIQLIIKSMKGKYSTNKFFQQFPKVIQTYFHSSKLKESQDIENLFDKAEMKLKCLKNKYMNNKELPISLIIFDEIGLAERLKNNPLKILPSKLDHFCKEEGLSFVGISNYSLDNEKINNAFVLSTPDLDEKLDDLIETSYKIAESISNSLKNDKIFEILSKTYFNYKRILQFIKELVVYKQFEFQQKEIFDIKSINKEDSDNLEEQEERDVEIEEESDEQINKSIKEKRLFYSIKQSFEFKKLFKKEKKINTDFHGNLDFYYLIKGIAKEFAYIRNCSDEDKVKIIIHYIERNFSGIEYEIDIDLNLEFEDIIDEVFTLNNILNDYNLYEENKMIKLSSFYLFKKLYNIEWEKIYPNSKLIIDKDKINEYNLNKCIIENIHDDNSRFLLLTIEQSLTEMLVQTIKLQLPFKYIKFYEDSPFINDNNKEYIYKIINEIRNDTKDDKLIIIKNLDKIHQFFINLYNKNYILMNDRKFARIDLDKFNEQLTLVNEKFRIILLTNKRFLNYHDLVLLSRFEKVNISLNQLLDMETKKIAYKLIEEINLNNNIKKFKNINYSLKDLLINTDDEDIKKLIYYLNLKSQNNDDEIDNEELNSENENRIREYVINKFYKILPQDIILILPENNIIKQKYFELKQINNFEDYIKNKDNMEYKITIIYTFTHISNKVRGLNKENSFMISEIESEDGLNKLINKIKINKENNLDQIEKNIYIIFDHSNSEKIKYISKYILNNLRDDGYNYIMIIHIIRNFNEDLDKIDTLPDIYPDINQIFLDNLESNNNMKLYYFLTKDIKYILKDRREDMGLDEEFKKTFNNFLRKFLKEIDIDEKVIEEYINEIKTYTDEENNIKDKIYEKVYELIDDDINKGIFFNNMIEGLFNNNYITINTIDIMSCLMNYIKEIIFNQYLKNAFEILENNNSLFTSLLDNIIKINNQKINMNILMNQNIMKMNNVNLDIIAKIKNNNKIKEENKDKINNKLKEENINLKKEIKKLKETISRYPLILSENEYIILLIIMTEDEKAIFSLMLKNTDKFIKIEEIFYEKYPEYIVNKGIFFLHNNIIDKNKTLEESGVKNNDIIIFKELK